MTYTKGEKFVKDNVTYTVVEHIASGVYKVKETDKNIRFVDKRSTVKKALPPHLVYGKPDTEAINLENNLDFEKTFKDLLIQCIPIKENHVYKDYKSDNINTKKILSEIKLLSESLIAHQNSTIFFITDPENIHLFKFMITGPKNTPYEGGFFEFDGVFGNDYPNKSPNITFLTTLGGTVRFNPNLYQCGKVCLSLLGTWSGPGWTKKSTLLQILISIQSMIFVKEPYYNEPYVPKNATKLSEEYNKNIVKYTKLSISETYGHLEKSSFKEVLTLFTPLDI